MKRTVRIAIAVLQVGMAVVFVLVVRQNLKFRRLIDARIADSPRFYAGDRLPQLPALDLSGRPATIDLQARTIVAVVNPTCASCAKTMADARGVPGVKLLSLVNAADTRPAVDPGIYGRTYTLGPNVPRALARKVHHYPQILLVDRGIVRRTCATLKECRD